MKIANPRRHRRRGFSLTEMLVVLGIILVLMSILLPAVMAAKRQSRRTACAARLRVIGQALQIFLSEHDDTLPQASMSNSLDSPESMAGFENHNIHGAAVYGGFLPGTDSSVKYAGPPGYGLPLAPMPYFLGKAAPPTAQVWSCPAIRAGKPGFFRTYQFVETGWPRGIENVADHSSGPLAGRSVGGNEFKPGYQFMGGAEFWWSITSGKDEPNRKMYHYDQFATRNIGGLRTTEIKPQGGQTSAEVVTFADYSVMAHSKETEDMWQQYLFKRMGDYSANFLYLDGHVDYHEFHSVGEYFKLLHRPIPQTWGSGKIQNELDAPDVWDPKVQASSTGGT